MIEYFLDAEIHAPHQNIHHYILRKNTGEQARRGGYFLRLILLGDGIVFAVFVQHVRTKAVASHLFTPLLKFIHLHLVYRSTLKITNTSLFLHLIMHLLLFLSPDWLILCRIILSLNCINSVGFFYLFSVSHWQRPTLETLDYTIRIGSTPTFLFFDFYLHTAYAAHYVH